MKNCGSRLDDWHGIVADYTGGGIGDAPRGGRGEREGGQRQMGGIGDGRDVMDYRSQFPG